MATKRVATKVSERVKPILSKDNKEARSRVIKLYKAWYREIPYVYLEYQVPATVVQMRQRLREIFLENKNVSDIRAIDRLVIKGQMELREVREKFMTNSHIMRYFKESIEPRPTDFMSKFYRGQE